MLKLNKYTKMGVLYFLVKFDLKKYQFFLIQKMNNFQLQIFFFHNFYFLIIKKYNFLFF